MNAIQTDLTEVKRSEDLLTQLDELLSNDTDGVHVSIYCPAGRMPEEAMGARIMFKNAVTSALQQLSDPELKSSIVEHRLDELLPLADDLDFWNAQKGGVAFFANSADATIMEIPAELPEKVVVSSDYFLKPLMALAANLDIYYILKLSQNSVSLLRGSALGIREVECPGLPESYAAAMELLGYPDESKKQLANTSGYRPREEELRVFLSEIDRSVSRYLDGRDAPLLVFGDRKYEPVYRKVNTYDRLDDSYLEGNPEHEDFDRIADQASGLLRSAFNDSQRRALNRFKKLDDVYENRVARGLKDVLQAAVNGQVDIGFVPGDTELWGTLDLSEEPAINEEMEPSMAATELYELAAREIIGNGGEVFFLDENQLPTDAKAIALLRWEKRE